MESGQGTDVDYGNGQEYAVCDTKYRKKRRLQQQSFGMLSKHVAEDSIIDNNINRNEKSLVEEEQSKKIKKRIYCIKCHRIVDTTCICSAFPNVPIILKKCHVIVLQHPHEHKSMYKHSSLPAIQLCLQDKQQQQQNQKLGKVESDVGTKQSAYNACGSGSSSITTIVGRRFGSTKGTTIQEIIDRVLNEKWTKKQNLGNNHVDSVDVLSNNEHLSPLKNAENDKHNKDKEIERTRSEVTFEVETTQDGNRPALDSLSLMKKMHASEPMIWLVYPSDDSIPLSVALSNYRQHRNKKQNKQQQTINSSNPNSIQPKCYHSSNDDDNRKKNQQYTTPTNRDNDNEQFVSNNNNKNDTLFLIFLDATWKYSKEMDRSNCTHHQYPNQTVRVHVDMDWLVSRNGIMNCGSRCNNDDANNTNNKDPCSNFIPRRFELIRTPISDSHLSTGECIAHIVSAIEEIETDEEVCQNNALKSNATTKESCSIFETLMKPLDLMVEQCRFFQSKNK